MGDLFKNPWALKEYIPDALYAKSLSGNGFPEDVFISPVTSSVLFLLGLRGDRSSEPCLVFNKRSSRVRQPGDLCFPGGRVAPRLDRFLSRVLQFPLSPLGRWRFWGPWRDGRREQARRLSLLLATSLRESAEEMRLNPFGVTFLGPMPPEELLMFQRTLYPMVAWINRQKHFLPNWEVERIVYVPLRALLTPESYACYRLEFRMGVGRGDKGYTQDFLCFRHQDEQQGEVLWGATFRIVQSFLEIVFGFKAPSMDSLPVIYRTLDARYLNGSP